MRYGRYGTSYFLLRLGLGLVFLWVGIDIFRHPDRWVGYVPASLPFGFTRVAGLQLTGLFDAVIGLLFITDNWPRITAWLAMVHLAGILITQGINPVIVRDVGLFAMALALLFWPHHGYRRQQWYLFWKRGNKSGDIS
ncbi:MAG: hypothetical protein Q8P73_02385 [bacterium]|nr:hypothetical protein [bacterium]